MAAMELGRREVLASILGASFVSSAACKREAGRRKVEGQLVDRFVTVGHHLRDTVPALAASVARTLDAVIVGGGAAGLSAGWRLKRAGLEDFLVCELDETIGGTAQSGQNSVSAYPWGAHYLPAPLTAKGPVPRLLKEMGVLTGVGVHGQPVYAEEALVNEPEERLFHKGHWYEGLYLHAGASRDDLAQWLRFEAHMAQFASARDSKGRKAFDVPVALSSDDTEWTHLDKLSAAQWLDAQGYTSPRLRWNVDYACRDDFGGTLANISAWAAVWYFTARRGKDVRSEGYLTWPDGNGHLIRHLATQVENHRIEKGFAVHTVRREGTHWRLDGIDATTRAPKAYLARQVVLAVPRFIAARLIESWRKSAPGFVKEFQYSPWVVANLTLSDNPKSRGFPTAWDNVLYESKSLGYVVATHQAVRARPKGPTVWTWYYPMAGNDVRAERSRLLTTGFDDWEAAVMTDLSSAHVDLSSYTQRLEVMRWGHAMVRPYPGFVWSGARQQAQASLEESLHFAHADLGGLAVFEEANHFGVQAAERVLLGLGRRTETWLG
jgi:protoporphyrinogen oxidase